MGTPGEIHKLHFHTLLSDASVFFGGGGGLPLQQPAVGSQSPDQELNLGCITEHAKS